jgi:hypothetical protein
MGGVLSLLHRRLACEKISKEREMLFLTMILGVFEVIFRIG